MKSLEALSLVILLLSTLIFSSVSAQGLSGKGLKAGLNVATLTCNEAGFDEGKKSRLGFCLGGFVTYNLDEYFAIQPEILFTMKGTKFDYQTQISVPDGMGRWDVIDISLKGTEKLNYLEIPILLKIIIPTEGRANPNLFAGPSLGLKLNSDSDYESSDISGIGDHTKSTDVGIIFGGGIDFGLNQGKLTVDARYILGLSNVYKTQSDFPEDDSVIKNGVFSVLVGYSFY